jgi:hypothetical protein
MLNFHETYSTANTLRLNDRFKMGGKMYQITSVEPNDYAAIVVHFHPIESAFPDNVLVVDATVEFKIWYKY